MWLLRTKLLFGALEGIWFGLAKPQMCTTFALYEKEQCTE